MYFPRSIIVLLISFVFVFWACEDLITMDLRDADPKIVIVGEINNQERNQEVSIYRTVPIGSETLPSPVSGAAVSVTDGRGQVFVFTETSPGTYRSRVFRGRFEMEYKLSVNVDGKEYTAVSRMPPFVRADSLGGGSNYFMGQESRFVAIKFTDPAGVANYYRYLLKKNEGPYYFVSVFDDRHNDGRRVSHELFSPEVKMESGDRIRVQRQCVDQATFQYWRSASTANPAASAPANPLSNISGGALGYFSAYSMNEYDIQIW